MMDSSQNNFLIQALSILPYRIEKRLSALPDDTLLTWQPQADEWSIQMVMTHLLNCEPFFQLRLGRIVDENNPTIAGFGPKEASPRSPESYADVLEAFKEARKETLNQIYTYSPDDWERPAVHKVIGETTLKGQIQMIVNHDMEHLGQIHDLLELWALQNNHDKIVD